jgi:hypothetical protein
MSTPKAPSPAAKQAAPVAPASTGIIASWVNFWFSPADPVGLHALRVLAGLLFLFWLLPFAGDHQSLFGLSGWFDATAYREASRLPELPPNLFGWSVLYPWGSQPFWLNLVTDPIYLGAAYWISVAVIVLFTLGLWTRVTGVLTWVAVVSYTANPALAYDADPLLVMLAFYLMFGYLFLAMRDPHPSLFTRLLGPRETWLFRRNAAPAAPSVAANLALRLFQVHFAIAMVASGLYKLQIKEWWNGLATWFYINTPFQTTLDDVRSYAPNSGTYLTLFTLASYLALAWQIAFPAFAWRRSVRPILLGGAAVAWLACAFFVPLPLFGPLMVVACLGYLSPEEWRRVESLAARLPGMRWVQSRLSPAPAGLAGPKGGSASRASVVSVGQHS